MSAIEFVKECGISNARVHLSNLLAVQIEDCIQDYIDELKQIIDAFELVFEHGSIDRAKKYADSPYTAPEIKIALDKAINLVEQCQ